MITAVRKKREAASITILAAVQRLMRWHGFELRDVSVPCDDEHASFTQRKSETLVECLKQIGEEMEGVYYAVTGTTWGGEVVIIEAGRLHEAIPAVRKPVDSESELRGYLQTLGRELNVDRRAARFVHVSLTYAGREGIQELAGSVHEKFPDTETITVELLRAYSRRDDAVLLDTAARIEKTFGTWSSYDTNSFDKHCELVERLLPQYARHLGRSRTGVLTACVAERSDDAVRVLSVFDWILPSDVPNGESIVIDTPSIEESVRTELARQSTDSLTWQRGVFICLGDDEFGGLCCTKSSVIQLARPE